MEYLKYILLSVINLVVSGGISYGLFKWLNYDVGSTAGALGNMVITSIISFAAFLILLGIVGFILFAIMF